MFIARDINNPSIAGEEGTYSTEVGTEEEEDSNESSSSASV
jgi:hypothetical protein